MVISYKPLLGGSSLNFMELAQQLISDYGYLGLYLFFSGDTMGVFLPSKSILAFIGVLINKGFFNFPGVLVSTVLGSLTGVTISFFIGKKIGKPFAQKYGKYIALTEGRLSNAEKWFNKYGPPVIVIAYFIPGLRHVTPYLMGITGVQYSTVMFFSAIGASLWVTAFVSLGRFLENYLYIFQDLFQ